MKPELKERFTTNYRRMGVKTMMLTDDNRITASVIAAEAGVDDFIAEATPEDEDRGDPSASRSKGKLVAMTGTALTTHRALAKANVGVAMNSEPNRRRRRLIWWIRIPTRPS
ncbi:MAG UNVERIFIED_CONTAM: hypothetical protein LVR29_14190 [Microcystis novacekii LVE1205-3]